MNIKTTLVITSSFSAVLCAAEVKPSAAPANKSVACSATVKRVTEEMAKADLAWLEARTRENVTKARRTMKDGTVAYAPQTGPGYNAFWLRDYAMTAETSADAYPPDVLVKAAKLFVSKIGPDGAGVDCIKFDGTPIYKPGLGRMGENPVADGPQFTVSTVWTAWRTTKDSSLLEPKILDALLKTLGSLPRSKSGTVWLDPSRDWDRCPWGFEDAVRMSGDVLIPSLLDRQAALRLAEMMRAASREEDARKLEARAESVKKAILPVFLNEKTGLLKAATVRGSFDSVWGTAFAVWTDAIDGEAAVRAAKVLKARYSDYVQDGQIRHRMPEGYPGLSKTEGRYQSGGYWGTASGWTAWTISLVDRDLAFSLLHDMVTFYREKDIPEWSLNGEGKGWGSANKGYLTSSAVPLAAFRRLLGKPWK